ncbi:hypothetical protein [Klebsiella pneumoniae]|uniref:hypothetical protein n=1 Tax=Klebsiella pneumoniae TaxID=573 RepID=UPI001645A7C5|nr:hypothetical protein [Klebsiella pneumoniae]EIV9525880.1 hypothetical protein [Klebsiella aerogenes]MBC4282945.1 hypothetical protein [Klebsiella pneumoniae]CAF2924929.1 hypothetical protein AI2954V5_3032 [Klebsiella pneumoniae]CAH5825241.1 hypothetical protein AI2954V5_3032 [Klebsiella pneumoniae]
MAMTNCKECKKEVSSKAKVCPHCGVKEPARNVGKETAQGCLGLVILVAVLYFFFGGSDDDKGDAKAKATTQQKECSANDSQCIFDRYIAAAAGPCKQLIEKSAKYDYEWTDGFLELPFSHMRNDPANHQMTFIGDKVKFTNGFNAKSTMTYYCTFDYQTKQVVDLKLENGKL